MTKSSFSSLKLSEFSTLIASFEKEDLTCLMMEFDLQPKDVLGIEYGPWYIKPRSLHWWELIILKLWNMTMEDFKKCLECL